MRSMIQQGTYGLLLVSRMTRIRGMRLHLFPHLFVLTSIVATANIIWFSYSLWYSDTRRDIEHLQREPNIRNGVPEENQERQTYPKPPMLLILSYQRSGSSYLGDLFGVYPGVFYLYEPLDALYMSLYGSREGWNVPTDITNYNNGSFRNLPDYETLAVSKYLDDLFNCRLTSLPIQIYRHRFWEQFSNEQKTMVNVSKCLHDIIGNQTDCATILKEVCNERFDATDEIKLKQCYEQLKQAREKPMISENTHKVFVRHKQCLTDAADDLRKCAVSLEEICLHSTLKVVKTVRMTTKSVEYLIKKNPTLKIINLVRDPRGVLLSRSKLLSTYGLYSEMLPKSTFANGYEHYAINNRIEDGRIAKPGQMDFTKEARMFCHNLHEDIVLRKQLQLKYPNVIYEVLYDEFIKHPATNLKELYRFVGVNEQDIHLANGDSVIFANKWKTELSSSVLDGITSECTHVYDILDIVS